MLINDNRACAQALNQMLLQPPDPPKAERQAQPAFRAYFFGHYDSRGGAFMVLALEHSLRRGPAARPARGYPGARGARRPCRKPSGVKTRAHAERRRLAVPEANIAETEFGTKPEAEAFLRGVRFAAMGAGVFDVVGVEQRKGRFFALVQVNRA